MKTAMQSLVEYLRSQVPLTRQIDIRAAEMNAQWFELAAPLQLNLNDKHTAFGGSLATLCTLAGWCVVSYLCREAGHKVDIAVTHSEIRYRLPITDDPFAARCYFPDQARQAAFLNALADQGNARLQLEVRVLSGDRPAVEFHGEYYAKIVQAQVE